MNFQEIYKNDIFATENGITLEELNDTHSIMSVKVEHKHLNGGSTAHGGLIFLLCDIAMAAMANHRQPLSVSIQSDIRFLAAAFEGDILTAEAVEVFGRKKLYNSRVSVTNQNGDLIAVAEGMFHSKRLPNG
ncbi:MAG: hotdog fold thioesterase [Rikenellaceae bacterium]